MRVGLLNCLVRGCLLTKKGVSNVRCTRQVLALCVLQGIVNRWRSLEANAPRSSESKYSAVTALVCLLARFQSNGFLQVFTESTVKSSRSYEVCAALMLGNEWNEEQENIDSEEQEDSKPEEEAKSTEVRICLEGSEGGKEVIGWLSRTVASERLSLHCTHKLSPPSPEKFEGFVESNDCCEVHVEIKNILLEVESALNNMMQFEASNEEKGRIDLLKLDTQEKKCSGKLFDLIKPRRMRWIVCGVRSKSLFCCACVRNVASNEEEGEEERAGTKSLEYQFCVDASQLEKYFWKRCEYLQKREGGTSGGTIESKANASDASSKKGGLFSRLLRLLKWLLSLYFASYLFLTLGRWVMKNRWERY